MNHHREHARLIAVIEQKDSRIKEMEDFIHTLSSRIGDRDAAMTAMRNEYAVVISRLEQFESAVKDAALALACKDIAEDAPDKALEYLSAAMKERQS